MSVIENSNQVFLPVVGNMVHYHMQYLKSLSAISYKM